MKKIAFAFAAAALCASVPALADDAPAAAAPDATAATATTTTTTETTTAAPAAAPAKGGVEIGLRVGYGIPLGTALKAGGQDQKMSDGVKGRIPIRLDAGYRITPNIYVGAYFAYGIVMLNKDQYKGACDQVSCSASSIDFGAMAAYHITPDQSMDPWVGVGFGFENLTTKVDTNSGTIKGLTFLDLQAGLDFKSGSNLMFGPFVSFALGQYSSVSSDKGSADIGSNGTDKALHEWLTIGIRGAYGIW